jgi:hypothetical protein
MVCLTQEGHIKRKTWTLGVCVNTNQFVTIDGLEISEVLREEKSYV